MHYLLYIAVDCDEDHIKGAIEGALDGYENDLWDWYEVGGRWDGVFGQGRNYLSLADDRDDVLKVLDDVDASQKKALLSSLRTIFGIAVGPGDVADRVIGLPVTDKEGAARRISEANALAHKRLKDLLDDPDLLMREGAMTTPNLTAAFAMQKVGDLLLGMPYSSCLLLDNVNGGTSTKYLRGQMAGEGTNDLWLVAVDIHN